MCAMAKKSEPTNPFRFGPLALDEGFTNRSDEMRELLADARNGQDVVILAPRRYGKSSLIWRVAQELVKEGVLVAQLDLMRTPTKDQLARSSRRRYTRSWRRAPSASRRSWTSSGAFA